VSARCCFIIARIIGSGQLCGFALLKKAAIWFAFAYHAFSAAVSLALSPALAGSSQSLSIVVRNATAFADWAGAAVADVCPSTPAAAIAARTIQKVRVMLYLLS
jgi:hypothetical protein